MQAELEALVQAGCREITVDEPSMSCYAYKEDTKRFVDIFNRTVAPVVGKRTFPRICVLAITRRVPWGRGSTRRCFLIFLP